MGKAEEFERQLEAEYAAEQNGGHGAAVLAPQKITVKDAVARFLNSKRNENLAESTLDKLKTVFEKQFLSLPMLGQYPGCRFKVKAAASPHEFPLGVEPVGTA